MRRLLVCIGLALGGCADEAEVSQSIIPKTVCERATLGICKALEKCAGFSPWAIVGAGETKLSAPFGQPQVCQQTLLRGEFREPSIFSIHGTPFSCEGRQDFAFSECIDALETTGCQSYQVSSGLGGWMSDGFAKADVHHTLEDCWDDR